MQPIIVWLWEILHEYTTELKKKFLTFSTGSDRVPYKGAASLSLVITRCGPDSNRLPVAHTCFNQLVIPEYLSKKKLKHLLTLAITNTEGFGLK